MSIMLPNRSEGKGRRPKTLKVSENPT
jgi:hypothetical protein